MDCLYKGHVQRSGNRGQSENEGGIAIMEGARNEGLEQLVGSDLFADISILARMLDNLQQSAGVVRPSVPPYSSTTNLVHHRESLQNSPLRNVQVVSLPSYVLNISINNLVCSI